MTNENHEFRVSAKELEYLKELASRDELLASLFRFKEGPKGRSAVIRLDRAEAEQLRKYLTTQLATYGFDEKYSPNEQGEMLETLIDKFFIRG